MNVQQNYSEIRINYSPHHTDADKKARKYLIVQDLHVWSVCRVSAGGIAFYIEIHDNDIKTIGWINPMNNFK